MHGHYDLAAVSIVLFNSCNVNSESFQNILKHSSLLLSHYCVQLTQLNNYFRMQWCNFSYLFGQDSEKLCIGRCVEVWL